MDIDRHIKISDITVKSPKYRGNCFNTKRCLSLKMLSKADSMKRTVCFNKVLLHKIHVYEKNVSLNRSFLVLFIFIFFLVFILFMPRCDFKFYVFPFFSIWKISKERKEENSLSDMQKFK